MSEEWAATESAQDEYTSARKLVDRSSTREAILTSTGRTKRIRFSTSSAPTVSVDEGGPVGGVDYSDLPLKPDHISRPLWACPDGAIYLEAFHDLYHTATDFLVAIAEPVSRPEFIHEYKLTPYSLYAAVATNITTESILLVLERLSKNTLPESVKTFVQECTKRYGKAKLVLKHNKFYVESEHASVLRELLKDPMISQARIVEEFTMDKDKAVVGAADGDVPMHDADGFVGELRFYGLTTRLVL